MLKQREQIKSPMLCRGPKQQALNTAPSSQNGGWNFCFVPPAVPIKLKEKHEHISWNPEVHFYSSVHHQPLKPFKFLFLLAIGFSRNHFSSFLYMFSLISVRGLHLTPKLYLPPPSPPQTQSLLVDNTSTSVLWQFGRCCSLANCGWHLPQLKPHENSSNKVMVLVSPLVRIVCNMVLCL